MEKWLTRFVVIICDLGVLFIIYMIWGIKDFPLWAKIVETILFSLFIVCNIVFLYYDGKLYE